jgi:hypothetical protein
MKQETETTSPEAEENAEASDIQTEQSKTISIADDSPMTGIWLQQMLRTLEREHRDWIKENPENTGFDPRTIKIRIITSLLIKKSVSLDEITGQIRDAHGEDVTGQTLENAWKEIRARLKKWGT